MLQVLFQVLAERLVHLLFEDRIIDFCVGQLLRCHRLVIVVSYSSLRYRGDWWDLRLLALLVRTSVLGQVYIIIILVQQLHEFKEELLGVRSDVGDVASLHVQFYHGPVFRVDSQGFKEQLMLFWRPPPYSLSFLVEFHR